MPHYLQTLLSESPVETPGAMHCNSFSWVVVLYDIDGPVRRPGCCNERCDMAGGQTMSKRNAPGSERGRSGRSRKGIRRASHSSMSSASFPPEVCVRAHGTIFTRVLPPPKHPARVTWSTHRVCLFASTSPVRLMPFVLEDPREVCQEQLCISTCLKASLGLSGPGEGQSPICRLNP